MQFHCRQDASNPTFNPLLSVIGGLLLCWNASVKFAALRPLTPVSPDFRAIRRHFEHPLVSRRLDAISFRRLPSSHTIAMAVS